MLAFARKTLSLMMASAFAAGVYGVSADISEARKSKSSGKHHSHHQSHKHNKSNRHHHSYNHHYKHDNWHYRHNHYGRWVAGGVVAGVTAAAIGSAIYSLPSGCRVVYSGGAKFWDCGPNWYQARYYGPNVRYVAVAPR